MRKSLLLFLILLIPAAGQSHDPDRPLCITISQSFPPLTFINAEGNPAGLFVDIWKLWSEKTGQKIEFLPSSWTESLENLKNGSADIHSGLAITPEREQWMNFSRTLYQSSSCLFFPVKQGKVSTVKELSGQRIGVIQNSSTEEWLNKNYPDIETVPFKSTQEAILSAREGNVQAVADSYLSTSEDIARLGLSGEFECSKDILYTTTLHVGIAKENKALLALIDKGFDAISDQEMADIEKRWIPDPEKRYYRPDTKKIRLTAEEEAWLKSHRTVRVGLAPDFPPLRIHTKEGIKGFTMDYLDLISQRGGVQFQYVPVEIAETDAKLLSREIDMFHSFPVPKRLENTLFTKPFTEFKIIIVTRSDAPFMDGISALRGRKVAVLKGIGIYNEMVSPYPDIERLEMERMEDLFRTVSESGAYATLSAPLFAGYLMQNYPNLKIAGVADHANMPFLYAVRRDWPELVSIVNKALASISREEQDAIFQKWCRVQVQYRANWSEILKWVYTVGIFFVLVLGVSLYWNRKLAKEISDRKHAESALREKEESLQAIFDVAGVGIAVTDIKGKIIQHNKALEMILGYTDAELENLPDDAISHPDDARIMEEHIQNIIAEKTDSCRMEKRYVHKNGSIIWADVSVTAVRDENGRILRLVGAGFDISNRKHAEEALRESEARWQFALEGVGDGVWDWDAQNNTVFFSDQWKKMIGYETHEIGNSLEEWGRRVHPDDKDYVYSQINRHFSGENPVYYSEHRIQCKDGSYKWILDSGKVMSRTSDGRPLRVIGTHKDITGRRQTEELLREKERLMSDIINFLPDATIVIDRHGKVLAWNMALESMTGIKAEEMLGKGDYEYAIPFYGERRPILIDLALAPSPDIEKTYTQIQRTGDKMTAENYYPNLGGREAWLFGHACVLRNLQGKTVGAIETINDITVRKTAEMELKKAKETAEVATRAKSEFLANMSHEIRTPMNSVVNMTRLLLDTKLDEEQRDYAETAVMSSEILLSLINDILDFSKIEAGKMELENRDFSLKETLASVVTILKAKTEEKRLWLKYSIDPDLHSHVTGDPVRVRQILLNFMNNAVKFTEKGGITVRVSLENQTDTHITVKFGVTDTGIGIPEDRRDRLFQPFSQADASTTRKYGGTGLGLAISRQLAELMGGQVGAESEEGKGSTFWFTAKMRKAEYGMTTGQDQYTIQHSPLNIHHSLRILVAEDNIFNQKVVLAILKKFGFSADIANNGREAVEALREKNYDLVFMDMQMPELDGIEAARVTRDPSSGGLNPQVPIIAMTANVTKADREKCLDAGMNGYISKPLDPARIISVIREQLPFARLSANREQLQVNGVPLTTDNCLLNTEIFDRQDFLYRLGGNEAVLKEILSDMPEYLSAEIKILKRMLDRNDAEKIRFHAHKIKGVTANISAEKLSHIAYEIEVAAGEGRSGDLFLLADRLEQEAVALQSVLSDMYPEIFRKSAEQDEPFENIPEKTKDNLPELLRMLEEEFFPKWKKYTEAFFIEETEQLAEELKHTGAEYGLDFVVAYSRNLLKAVKNYNFDEWEKLVAEFPAIMDRIRKMTE